MTNPTEAIDEALKEFIGTELIFPGNVTTNIITFGVIQAKNTGEKSGWKATILKKDVVVLPVPDNLITNYGATYNSENFDFTGKLTGGISGDPKDAAKTLKATKNTLGTLGGKLLKDKAGQTVGGALGVEVKTFDYEQFNNKKVINPHMALLYQGHGFRTHVFEYKFYPENVEDSRTLSDILKHFKKNSHSETNQTAKEGGGDMVSYPKEWFIEIRIGGLSAEKNPHIHRIKPSVLTTIDVNYNVTGIPAFYPEGAPVGIGLTLTFQETKILSSKDIDKGY